MQKYKCPACGKFNCTIVQATQNQWCDNCQELDKLNTMEVQK